MSESLPLQSEDPLPGKRVYPYFGREKDVPSTIGELVSTDQRDPFLWLSSYPTAAVSESAKRVMWMLYRMDSPTPIPEGEEKLRDKDSLEGVFERLSDSDMYYIDRYQKNLVSLDVAESMKKPIVEALQQSTVHDDEDSLELAA